MFQTVRRTRDGVVEESLGLLCAAEGFTGGTGQVRAVGQCGGQLVPFLGQRRAQALFLQARPLILEGRGVALLGAPVLQLGQFGGVVHQPRERGRALF